MRFCSLFFFCFACWTAFAIDRDDGDFLDSSQVGVVSGGTAIAGMFAKADVAFANLSISGSTAIKGSLGEAYANNIFLTKVLKPSGNWIPISPRVGPQGIDHVFLKTDIHSGLPSDIIVGESKYNTSRLGNTKDGLQLGSKWTNRRLVAMGNRYLGLTTVSEVSSLAGNNPNQSMNVRLRNGKTVSFWRRSSLDSWKFSGLKAEMKEARNFAKHYGLYLRAAGEGAISYRSRLFQIIPSGDDLSIIVRDARNLDFIRDTSRLKETQRVFLKGVLNDRLPESMRKNIEIALQKKFPNYSQGEIARLVDKNMSAPAKNVINPYGKFEMFKTFSAYAGKTGVVAILIDAGFQIGFTGEINAKRVFFMGGAVSVGTMGAQYVDMWLVKNARNCRVIKVFRPVAGGLIVGGVVSYGSFFMGYTDLRTANRMMVANVVGVVLGGVVGCFRAPPRVCAAVAIAGAEAVMKGYEALDRIGELKRVSRLCEYFSEDGLLEKMVNRSPMFSPQHP